MTGRTIPGTGTPAYVVVAGPSRQSISVAGSMAAATNTASPMSAGLHGNGQLGYNGDPGYGVNRFSGRVAYEVQRFYSAVRTAAQPSNRRVGIGAGVSGQPGMPSTGGANPTDAPLAWMSVGQVTNLGMGG